jgi:hypothetical protein
VNRNEAAALLSAVAALWPHSNLGPDPEVTVSLWAELLSAVDLAEATEAVKELAVSGREHAPPPGVVLRTAVERAEDVPAWGEAWEEIVRLLRRRGTYWGPGGTPGAPPEDVFSHPAIARFAIPAWRELALAPGPGAPGFGTHYAQTRDAYNAIRGRRVYDRGLAVIGAPRRRALGRLDPDAALGGRFSGHGERADSPVALEPGPRPARAGRATPRP